MRRYRKTRYKKYNKPYTKNYNAIGMAFCLIILIVGVIINELFFIR